jgi:hypothetical protein
MDITLEEIIFNPNVNSATTAALNLRRTNSLVRPPEWQRGVTLTPQQSVAAYAISGIQNAAQPLTVQARFRRTSFQANTIRVRTRDFSAPSTNAFGRVRDGVVNFPPFTSESGFHTFELENVRLSDFGVRAHTITWRWQFCVPPDETWADFATSTHTIYAVLELPKLPWQLLPFNATNFQLPWVEVLDVACRWAAGARSLDDAATQVTRQVNGLGPAFIRYDCANGAPHFTDTGFHCERFLARLNNLEQVSNQPVPRVVNCCDCASIVTTFANVLGCDLSTARMGGGPAFDLNPVLTIGSDVWSIPCGRFNFGFHEVAWKAGATADDALFDACLQLDGDINPAAEPHTPLLPANIIFGRPGDGLYRDRMVIRDTPQVRQTCDPLLQPFRRFIHAPGAPLVNFLDLDFLSTLEVDFAAGGRITGDERLARLKEEFDFTNLLAAGAATVNIFSSGFLLSGDVFPGWQQSHSAAVRVAEDIFSVQTLWTRKRGDKSVLLEVDVYECASRAAAQEFLLALIDLVQASGIAPRAAADIGEVAFSRPADTLILFARGNLAASVTTADGGAHPVADIAAKLDRYIARRPRPSPMPGFAPPPVIERFTPATEDFQVDSDVPLTVTAADPTGRHLWYKFFSRRGEVASVNGRLHYHLSAGGKHNITAFVLNTERSLAKERLELSV